MLRSAIKGHILQQSNLAHTRTCAVSIRRAMSSATPYPTATPERKAELKDALEEIRARVKAAASRAFNKLAFDVN